MPSLLLITDTTADLPHDLARELGVRIVPATCAFCDHSYVDGELAPALFFDRMATTGETPRPSGVRESDFRAAFDAALEAPGEAVCLVMPFDVIPTFTTAAAAVVNMDEAGAAIKVSNPGVSSAGLCSLVASLSAGVAGGWTRARVLSAIDELEPRCETVFVPAETRWLDQAGRLAMMREKLGPLDDAFPVCRVGTRITGLAVESSREAALRRAVSLAAQRAGATTPVIVTIDHAADPATAETTGAWAREAMNVARLITTELSPTIGSQFGPGAIGIGVAPVALED